MTRAAPKRGQPGYVHPNRDLEREDRIIRMRLSGAGPTDISRKEGVGRTYVMTVLNASGKVFPEIRRGPKPGSQGARSQAPRTAPARPKPEPIKIRNVVDPWAPLPGTAPVPLLVIRSGCRWPVQSAGEGEALMCGARASEGSYCPHHRALSLSTNGRAGDPHPSCTGVRRVA